MTVDIFSVAWDCYSCARTRVTAQKNQKHLKLFRAAEVIEIMAVSLLGLLPKMENEQHFVLVIACRLSKLACSVSLWTTTAPVSLPCSWAILCRRMAAEGDNGRQLIAEFIDDFCAMLGATHYLTTVPPQRVRRPSGLVRPTFEASAITSRSVRETGKFTSDHARMLVVSKLNDRWRRLPTTWFLEGLRPVREDGSDYSRKRQCC